MTPGTALGMVAHSCNQSTWSGRVGVGQVLEAGESRVQGYF